VSGDRVTVGGKIKAAISFVIQGIADEEISCGIGSKLMWRYRRKVRVVSTPKDSKMLVGTQCVMVFVGR
jgi:hypothetical protein